MEQSNYEAVNVNVLNVAKEEYTHQLTRVLAPLILQGIESIYHDALELSSEKELIRQFQELLKEVPKWNNHMIKEECERILQVQDWMHDLVTAIFVTNVKILTSVKIVRKQSQFKLKMPSFETFVHAVYIEVARTFFTNPFLLYHNESIKKLNKNKKESNKLIKECIEETIRILLPVQHILQEYMKSTEEDEEYEKEDGTSARDVMNTDITNNDNVRENQLRQMVQRDINGNQSMINNNIEESNLNSENNNLNNANVDVGENNDNESNDGSDGGEYEDIGSEDGEEEEMEEEDEEENVRSVQINDKKSQDKIKNNMANTSESRMERYSKNKKDESDDSDEESE